MFSIACVVHLQTSMGRLRERYSHTRSTAFGRVDVIEIEARLYDALSGLVAGLPAPALYCYPTMVNFYLMTGQPNPTRFQFFRPGYNSPDQMREIVAALEAKKVPYIVALRGYRPPNDLVSGYIEKNYEPVDDGELGKWILRRKGAGAEA
jgi:hypothetical protein